MERLDVTEGQRFNRLTILREVEKKTSRRFECLCECGNKTIVTIHNLKNGHTQSCGCLMKERTTKHGLATTRLYDIWYNMNKRCNDNNARSYKDYGGRGIKVCDEWHKDVALFYNWAMINGYDKNLTINRINNDGNYEPSNCEWITQKENSRKTRRTKLTPSKAEEIRLLLLEGFTQKKIADKFGVDQSTVSYIKSNRHWEVASAA